MQANEVALCGPVVAELRRGLRPGRDRNRVLELFTGCQLLEQPRALWEEAGDLGGFLGRQGASVKSFDLLIATYALAHAVEVLTRDADFDLMQRAGVGLRLYAR